MNEEQAKQWLVNNGFYSEFDKPSSETHLAEAVISVDDEHVEIVMKLTEKKLVFVSNAREW